MTKEEKANRYAFAVALNYMEENQALPDDQTINDFTMTYLAGYEVAEKEARERAVKAFCNDCKILGAQTANCVNGFPCERLRCFKQFQNHSDNE